MNNKYTRIFAFGCSFTNYWFPTWADILSVEFQPREYYNFALGGAGNIFINNRISQVNNIFNFSDTDLILVMFSSFTREDRYVDKWQTLGNIYNQSYYPANFVKNFCNPDWYMLRDYAVIDMTTSYLKRLPCRTDYHIMSSPLAESENKTLSVADKLEQIYGDIFKDFYPQFIRPEIPISGFMVNDGKTMRKDMHPSPLDHLRYLQLSGYILSESTINQVLEFQRIVDSCPNVTTMEQLVEKKSHHLII